jgi:hypothetical protein
MRDRSQIWQRPAVCMLDVCMCSRKFVYVCVCVCVFMYVRLYMRVIECIQAPAIS